MAASSPAQPVVAERPIVHVVVQQHAEEAALLRHVRSSLVRAPHVGLLQLGRLDERIAAHLDGLAVAGKHGTAYCVAALERAGAGEVFALAVRAIESRDRKRLQQALALVGAAPDAARGIASALGWVSASDLQGVGRELLAAGSASLRALGLTACRMHGVDPGPVLAAALHDEQAELRAAALRTAAELGRVDLLPQARESITSDNPELVFWAAWASCLLGDRQASLRVLAVAAAATHDTAPWAERALALAMLASPFDQASALARSLSQAAQTQADAARQRRLIRALGLLGDARFVPWLIDRMSDPTLMRLAGEAFSWIAGVDLARADLETLQAPPRPEHPSDDPDDDDVSLDEDESLPWPDADKIRAWWSRQASLQTAAAAGQRLFCGEPASASAATRVLREGTQRLRALAALWLCVLQPGSKLFQVAAPTVRQQRWLGLQARAS
ncbi:MAG: TIGR02270 family protein [Burkholderiaceae bacterium]|nr:TIGR02270 family protein [Burkholderiaceae bacterium]